MGLPRGHLWSLAIEEHFYLVLPAIIMLLLVRSRIHLLPIIALATMLLCTTLRCLTTVPTMGDPKDHLFFPWFSHMYPTHMRIDGLFFGVLLAYLYHFKPAVPALATRFRWLLMVLGLALVSPMMFLSMEKNPWIPQIGFTMLYLGYGAILCAALAMNVNWIPASTGPARLAALFLRAIGWVGLFSYPIYLWHQDLGRFPVQYMLDANLFNFTSNPALQWLLATTLYFTLAITLSALIGKLIERPVLLLRDRLFPRRAPALDTTTPEPQNSLEYRLQPEPAIVR
jgi:peptidoglycan/LPS O-acetylase OafA/YrhL